MATSFYGGAFYGGEFYNTGTVVAVTARPQTPAGRSRKHKEKRKFYVFDRELTEPQLKAVVERAADRRRKLEPRLEEIAREWSDIKVEAPTFPAVPFYDALADQLEGAQLAYIQKLMADLQDEEDIEILLLT